jgi:hypothetical protein
MTTNHSDFEATQRASQARHLGAALYNEAVAISPVTVVAVAAVVNRMEALHDDYLILAAEESARAMVADKAEDHLANLHQA